MVTNDRGINTINSALISYASYAHGIYIRATFVKLQLNMKEYALFPHPVLLKNLVNNSCREQNSKEIYALSLCTNS